MKNKFLILTSLLAVALWVAPASAYTDSYGSTADFSLTAGGQLELCSPVVAPHRIQVMC